MITRDNIIELSKNLKEPQWVNEKRLKVFDLLNNFDDKLNYGLGMLSDYSKLDFDNSDYSFDGVNLSCEGARVLSFKNASKDQKISQLLKKSMFTGHFDLESNKFLGLTAAAFTEGYCVVVDKESPSQLEMIIAQQPANSLTYVTIIVKSGVRSTILENIDVNNNHHLIFDIFIDEGASLNLISSKKYQSNQNIFISRAVHIAKGSKFEELSMARTQAIYHERVRGVLEGSDSECYVNLGFFGEESAICDVYTEHSHIAQGGKSDIMVKGVVSDTAQAYYRGLVHMAPKAVNSLGFQRADLLSVSNMAKVRAVPLLKIENNEVKCSHGVTTSHLNEESLFYMQSRGLDMTQAKNEGVKAHLSVIEDKLSTYLTDENDI